MQQGNFSANRSRERWSPGDPLLSFASCAVVVLATLARSPECQHWFVIPVWICGGLAGVDALGWVRGRYGTFDPRGIVGLLGLHLFFAAPLMHVAMDHWMGYVEPPPDWRPWLGRMACVNALGLAAYLTCATALEAAIPLRRTRNRWTLAPDRVWLAWPLALAATAVLQALVYARFGGISGFVNAFGESPDAFAGLGFVFMFSEAFPILLVIASAEILSRTRYPKGWITVFAVLVAFVAAKLLFGGLRGSRGHLIYGLFWAAGIIHLRIRPIPKQAIVLGVALLVGFMYLYGFYKNYGRDAVEAFRDGVPGDFTDVPSRDLSSVLLGDLARADIQAYLLYRLSPDAPTRAEYALGETYVGAAALLVPRSLLPEKPPTKVKAGTDALFGRGEFDSGFVGTFAYGVVGEAMLNFGPVAAFGGFLVMAVAVTLLRRLAQALPPDDSRGYLVPFALSLSFMMPVWDSDVLLFYTVKEGLLPAFLVTICSIRYARSALLVGAAA